MWRSLEKSEKKMKSIAQVFAMFSFAIFERGWRHRLVLREHLPKLCIVCMPRLRCWSQCRTSRPSVHRLTPLSRGRPSSSPPMTMHLESLTSGVARQPHLKTVILSKSRRSPSFPSNSWSRGKVSAFSTEGVDLVSVLNN